MSTNRFYIKLNVVHKSKRQIWLTAKKTNHFPYMWHISLIQTIEVSLTFWSSHHCTIKRKGAGQWKQLTDPVYTIPSTCQFPWYFPELNLRCLKQLERRMTCYGFFIVIQLQCSISLWSWSMFQLNFQVILVSNILIS